MIYRHFRVSSEMVRVLSSLIRVKFDQLLTRRPFFIRFSLISSFVIMDSPSSKEIAFKFWTGNEVGVEGTRG
jgi:hypothetical protein